MWNHVIENFSTLFQNAQLTQAQRDDIATKTESINDCLSAKFYPSAPKTNAALVVGSHGKNVSIRPPSDVDTLYALPHEILARFNQRVGNQQSQILAEIRETLLWRFPNTEIRGDGQVVVVDFSTIKFEVVPAFRRTDNKFITCDSNDGGSWRLSDPVSENSLLTYADALFGGKARDLVRILKCWKYEHMVSIKSVQLEVLACVFLLQWRYNQEGIFYYDWMVRDFFKFLLGFVNGSTILPGTTERLSLGEDWKFKAERAHRHALEACDNEWSDYKYLAREEWEKIVGSRFHSLRGLFASGALAYG